YAPPRLGAPEQGDPEEAAHDELATAVNQPQRAAIDASRVGIEDVSADVLPVLRVQVAQQHEADDRLVVSVAGASCAAGAVVVAWGARLDPAVVEPIGLEDADQPERLARAIERLPEADGRCEPRTGSGRRDEHRPCEQSHHER